MPPAWFSSMMTVPGVLMVSVTPSAARVAAPAVELVSMLNVTAKPELADALNTIGETG